MDANYRWMKHIYDLPRPLFLLGRNRLLRRIAAENPQTVLEIGVGTGRNLRKLAKLLPATKLYGSDISPEMLTYANSSFRRAGAADRITTVEADGMPRVEDLSHPKLFDVIFFSYSLSMIPNWQKALRDAAAHLSISGGTLMLVDFGLFSSWPKPIAAQFHRNLQRFHATARADLKDFLHTDPMFQDWQIESQSLGGDWAYMHVLKPPHAPKFQL